MAAHGNYTMTFWMYVSSLILLITECLSTTCSYSSIPAAPDGTNLYVDSTYYKNGTVTVTDVGVGTMYELDKAVLFECDTSNGFAFGAIVYLCKGNDAWTANPYPARTCTDPLPVESGSIVGICFGTLTLIVTILAVVLSRAFTENPNDKEDDLQHELQSDVDPKEDTYRVNHVFANSSNKDNDIQVPLATIDEDFSLYALKAEKRTYWPGAGCCQCCMARSNTTVTHL